jgi:hypothetical protein
MGIAGAAPYSLVLIAGRELVFLHTRSSRFAGFGGCSLRTAPTTAQAFMSPPRKNDQQSITQRQARRPQSRLARSSPARFAQVGGHVTSEENIMRADIDTVIVGGG